MVIVISFHSISFHVLRPACPEWHLGAKFFVIYRASLVKKGCENKQKARIKRATGQGWQTSRSSVQNLHIIIIGIVGNNNSRKCWHISLLSPQTLTDGNMFLIHSFHMFGMRSCVPNSLRMLCCAAKVFFATSFHARFC